MESIIYFWSRHARCRHNYFEDTMKFWRKWNKRKYIEQVTTTLRNCGCELPRVTLTQRGGWRPQHRQHQAHHGRKHILQSAARHGDQKQRPGAPRVSSAHKHNYKSSRIERNQPVVSRNWAQPVNRHPREWNPNAAPGSGGGQGDRGTHHLELGAVYGEVVVAPGAGDEEDPRKVSCIYTHK
jgi:hypothetical protein